MEKHNKSDLRAHMRRAIALFRDGNLSGAQAACEEALSRSPDHFDALHLLGLIICQSGQLACGLNLINKAISANPNVAEAYNDRGNILALLQRWDEALANFDKSVELKPDLAETYLSRGNVLRELNRNGESVAAFDKAIKIRPHDAVAHYNRGNSLRDLERHHEAIAAYDKAIQLKPEFAEAFSNRGNVLRAVKRLDEAIASFDKAIQLKPDYAVVHYNRGGVLQELERLVEAVAAYDNAIVLKPDFAAAFTNRGNALQKLSRLEEALASHDKVIQLKPDDAEAYANRGSVLLDLGFFEESIASYEKAFELAPNLRSLCALLGAKLPVCDWRHWEEETAKLREGIEHGEKGAWPRTVLALPSSRRHQLSAARAWTSDRYPPNNSVLAPSRAGDKPNKLRIGYFSSDFRNHATAWLIAELIEKHDRHRFEIIAFSLGGADDEMRRRLMAGFDRFIDVQGQSDKEVVLLARRIGIDIAVDVNGFNTGSRTNIFAMRAAPIQVNYLSYPGTMGADYIDYLVADPTVIPADHRQDYVEKIVYLPDTYQATNTKPPISDRTFTRAELGLPSDGFVFCCFNNTYKVAPEVFDDWMSILAQVPGSVLWLLETYAIAKDNLRREAERRGIAGQRLVFAGRMASHDHLVRHRLADLFLDTLPYNAHTTASDALWAGLPVLTRLGETFAGRVAASLLNAIGLPELITSSRQSYRDLAVELATHASKLEDLKRRLANNRSTTPLFDIDRYVHHLEAAYMDIHARYDAGLPPDDIHVQPLHARA